MAAPRVVRRVPEANQGKMVRVRDMALDLTHQVMAVRTVTVHTVKAALLQRAAVDPRRAAAKESTAGPAAAAVAKAMAAEIARIRAKVTAKAAEKTEAKIVHACPESVFAAQDLAVTFAESPCFSHVRGLRPLA